MREEDDRIRQPRLGWIRMKARGCVPTDQGILSSTVKAETGRRLVSVLASTEISVEEAAGPAAGVNLGVNALATQFDGRAFEIPRALLSRERSRRTRGGRTWEETRQRIARLHAHIRCIRRGALHTITGAMAAKPSSPQERPAAAVIEDRNVSGMAQHRRLSGAVLDRDLNERLNLAQ